MDSKTSVFASAGVIAKPHAELLYSGDARREFRA
jgi:hypothetical protein